MSTRFLSVVAVSFTLAAGSWAAPSGADELDDTSVKLFNMQKAAAERDKTPQAEYYLAQMYENGLGTAEDTNKARELYQRAADKGLVVAKLQLKELERAEQLEQAERKRAAERAAARANAQQANASNAKVAAAIDDEAAEAARRADREKARAERKRRAMEMLRKATAAAKADNPFGEE
jgi:regulator of protease activity HflC (stomatin/prohibitin superfamily)